MTKTNKKILDGKKISILGMARSGIAAAQLLQKMGANVFVSDNAREEQLGSPILNLKSFGIEYEAGRHSDRVLDADIIVISPGVSSNASIIKEAEKLDLKIVSEIEAASWFCKSPIIAVTGTNGKTTTTTLIGKMLNDAKIKHIVGGNIGNAFSGFVHELDESSIAVLEVSSFQLDFIETFHPRISIILNITPDHLDRYDNNFEKYIASKCRIFENQTKEDYLVYNFDDEQTCEQVRRFAGLHVHTLPFGIDRKFDEGAFVEGGNLVTSVGGKRNEIIEIDDIKIRGIHNLYNAIAAVLASQLMGVSSDSLEITLKTFKGVEHRLELVREINGVKFINDSKATNVESVWYALQAYKEPLIVLIGGRDKGNDYSKLFDLVKKNVKAIVAIGETAEKVYQEFSPMKKVIKALSMEEAVRKAADLAVSGDIVLLSPACASFDWFQNYEHRGQVFKEIVRVL
ncbi:MAG: UDP-N-acetylmuramoyl-L-alanine--D-glutamate ligase [Bacteroidota bacterium]|nr:UDP-N-acetylmuramoyl-L-alanine--D-glutamate ligase [Bacteroidota bacterium]